MHINPVFIILARPNDIGEKIQWAKSLCESYQNSRVIIRFISTEPLSVPEWSEANIELIHHPSNRPIEPHIQIIQQAKLRRWPQFYYITNRPRFPLQEQALHEGLLDSVLLNGETVVGYMIDAGQLCQAISQDINTINHLRQDLHVNQP